MGDVIRFQTGNARAHGMQRISHGTRRTGWTARLLVASAALALLVLVGWRTPEQAPSRQTSPGSAQVLQGRANVIDGDTIRIGGERIRLNGVDAPESRQLCEDAHGAPYRCGSVAANALDEFLAASRPTRCTWVSTDRYGRFVGECARADGADVAGWLVRQGLAIEWVRYSGGRYSRAQETARAGKVGVWQGRFDLPWEWRAAHAQERRQTSAPQAQ